MSLLEKSLSAIGKLVLVVVLAGAFLFGLVGVVYMSLQGEELKVPDLIGKDLIQSEKELAQLGIKIKKRAERFSNEKQNVILEQRPKAGDTVKTGQMILVVVSKENPEGRELPTTIQADDEEDDIEKIEELISDKPKTSSKNSEKKKKTRDVKVEKKDGKADENADGDADASGDKAETKGDKGTTTDTGKSENSTKTDAKKTDAGGKSDADKQNTKKPDSPKTEKPKPKVDNPPASGETRPRKTP